MLVVGLGCANNKNKPPPRSGQLSKEPVGECIEEISAAGAVSESPTLRHADRDLNGDGRQELVVSDKNMCRGNNCQWNIFSYDGACHRYVGTISGAAIETGPRGERGFFELRSWWRFSDSRRALLHIYQFGGLGYQLAETLICHQKSGDGIRCASQESL